MVSQLSPYRLSLALGQALVVSAQFTGIPSGFSGFGGFGSFINAFGPPCGYQCEQTLIPQLFQPFVCANYTDVSCICSGWSNANQALGDAVSYCIRSGCGSGLQGASNLFYNLCNATASPTPASNSLNVATGTNLPTPYIAQVTPTPNASVRSLASRSSIASTPRTAAGFVPASQTATSGTPPEATGTMSVSGAAAASSSVPPAAAGKRVMPPGEIAGITVGVVVGLVVIFIVVGAIVAKIRSAKRRNPQGYYDYPHMSRPGYEGNVGNPYPAPAYEKDAENAIYEKDVRAAPPILPTDRSTAQELPANMPAAHEMQAGGRPDMSKPEHAAGESAAAQQPDITRADSRTSGSTFQQCIRVHDEELTHSRRSDELRADAGVTIPPRFPSPSLPSNPAQNIRPPFPPAYQPRGKTASAKSFLAAPEPTQLVALRVDIPHRQSDSAVQIRNDKVTSGDVAYSPVDLSTQPKIPLPVPPSGAMDENPFEAAERSASRQPSSTPESNLSSRSSMSSSSSSNGISPVISPDSARLVTVQTAKRTVRQSTLPGPQRHDSTASSHLVSPMDAGDIDSSFSRVPGRRFPVYVSGQIAALARQQSHAMEFAKHLNAEAQQLLKQHVRNPSTTDLEAQK